MVHRDIAQQRLVWQGLGQGPFTTPGEVVHWLGAVQAQDYAGSLWALGLRMRQAREQDIEQALADRTIVRTWPMRGTLHFVAAADVRWMLALLTPRVVAGQRPRLRQLELDDATLARSRELIVGSLQGGKQQTRSALYRVLEQAGIALAGTRGLYILNYLAQLGVICFGAREGKQQTFALLDEWVPRSTALDREAALAELARRYFTSRGPALAEDFAWWSGLTLSDARAALEMARPHLEQATIDGQAYWFSREPAEPAGSAPVAHLLPMYDEYTVAYKDRAAVLDPAYAKQAGNGIFRPVIVVRGQVAGTWKRTPKKGGLAISATTFVELTKADRDAVDAAAQRYAGFLGTTAGIAYRTLERI